MNFTAPYRFVPLNKHVFIPHFVEGYPENISQDVPFKYGKDGSIEVEFTNITPILVAGASDDKNSNLKEPQVVKKAGKEYFVIPGSSWKGMIRSVMEIMSFAKMQPYDNETFGYRNVGAQNDSNYNQKMQAALCGWLYKEGKSYYLLSCGGIEKISKDEIAGYGRIENKNIIEKLRYYNKDEKVKDWKYPEKEGKILVFTGPIRKKEHEYLFSKPESIKSQPICVTEEVIKKFFSVYRNSPYNDEKGERFIETWLGDDKYLPVFYLRSGDKVTDIGITRMFRLPYKHKISDFIRQDSKVGERDLVECIFGYTDTETKSSLKGRVQFGHTLVPKDCDLSNPIGGVLGEPKASFSPFYLKQNGNKPQTYDSDGAEIAGRKRYAIHKEALVADLPKGNGNEKIESHLCFVPAGRSLRLTVHFHNLLPVELGALLSAITFHGHKGCYYNIGMAKGYGYGKLELKNCTVEIGGKKVEKDEFLSCFEIEMNRFADDKWEQSEQIQALLGIASGTIPEVNLKTMEMEKNNNNGENINEFEQCRNFKKNPGERNLRDWESQSLETFVSEDDKTFQTIDRLACEFEKIGKWEKAIDQYSQILQQCKNKEYLDYAEAKIVACERKQQHIKELLANAQRLESENRYEDAIKVYEDYQNESGVSVADKIAALSQKIDELKEAKAQSVLDEADQLRKSGQYAEAIEKYREYEQSAGLSKAQDILYCEEQLEKLSKPIAERLPYSSPAAFVNSLKKTLVGKPLTAEELKTIGRKLAENVKEKEKKKWQNSAPQFKGILSDEQVAELLNYVK